VGQHITHHLYSHHEAVISGEHGIGITKAPYLEMDIGKQNQAFMKRIKDLLDPNGILNPGKLSLT